jgi:hypothetical protein
VLPQSAIDDAAPQTTLPPGTEDVLSNCSVGRCPRLLRG